MADRPQSRDASCTQQQAIAQDRFSHAIRSCGITAGFNRRMREDRLSGGVGGVAGEIPSLRPDPSAWGAILGVQSPGVARSGFSRLRAVMMMPTWEKPWGKFPIN